MNSNWKAPEDWLKIKTIEAHTAGEPLRIYIDGLPEIKGQTILEKRKYFKENFDFIRTGTIFEPRGHADMYGAIITEPLRKDSDFGTFFLHNEGYSTMCGHAIIALTKIAFQTGFIKKYIKNPLIKIDTPAGQVTAFAKITNNKVTSVSFQNVPSFVYKKDLQIEVEDIGSVKFDIAFGGAFYAYVNADEINLDLSENNHNKIIEYGKKIKNAVMKNIEIKHPFEKDLSFLYGTIFISKAKNPKNHSRNVCIFAEGELDRSPTGTGVSARAAIHFSRNEIKIDQSITIESILGTCFDVKVVKETKFGGFNAIIPEVSGNAYITGKNTFYFDPEDPLIKGFIFR